MNKRIKDYFDGIEILMVSSNIIEHYEIIRQDISTSDGKIRIKVKLVNLDTVELFEYVELSNSKILIKKYHHHWQSSDCILIRRWDNAPHHIDLDNFPHHIHFLNSVESLDRIPDIKNIINTIEKLLHFQ